MGIKKPKVHELSSSEFDLVGDHYAFIREMSIESYIKMLIDERYFLEAIGTIYMRLIDNIETCVSELVKYADIKFKPRMMAGKLLRKLKDKRIINKEIYEETRKFIKVRNDVVHNRWDDTIANFRTICEIGLELEGFFNNLVWDFLEFRMGGNLIGEDMIITKEGKIRTVKHKKNIKLFRKLKSLSKKCFCSE